MSCGLALPPTLLHADAAHGWPSWSLARGPPPGGQHCQKGKELDTVCYEMFWLCRCMWAYQKLNKTESTKLQEGKPIPIALPINWWICSAPGSDDIIWLRKQPAKLWICQEKCVSKPGNSSRQKFLKKLFRFFSVLPSCYPGQFLSL